MPGQVATTIGARCVDAHTAARHHVVSPTCSHVVPRYECVTAHFIDQHYKRQSLCLSYRLLPEVIVTADEVAANLEQVLTKFGIRQHRVVSVTAGIPKASQPCVCDTMQRAVSALLRHVWCGAVGQVVASHRSTARLPAVKLALSKVAKLTSLLSASATHRKRMGAFLGSAGKKVPQRLLRGVKARCV